MLTQVNSANIGNIENAKESVHQSVLNRPLQVDI